MLKYTNRNSTYTLCMMYLDSFVRICLLKHLQGCLCSRVFLNTSVPEIRKSKNLGNESLNKLPKITILK